MATVFTPNTFVAGTPAVATEVNQNFTALTDQINGNLDADNLADNAVTEAKLAPGSVTGSKIGAAEVDNDKLGAGINAAKIADGSVSDTEFEYLSGATSNIQDQINGLYTPSFSSGTVSLAGTTDATVLLPAGFLIARYTTTGSLGDVVFEILVSSIWHVLPTATGSSAGGGGSVHEVVQVFSDGTNIRARNAGGAPASFTIGYQRIS
jgi:hypothetical protein